MRLTQNSRSLAGIALLMGGFYTVQVNASSVSFTGGSEQITYPWTFTRTDNDRLPDKQVVNWDIGFGDAGAALSVISLWQGEALVDSVSGATKGAAMPVLDYPELLMTDYNLNLSNNADSFGLGFRQSTAANVGGVVETGILSFTGAVNTPPTSIPLPSVTWLFLAAVVGYLGLKGS